MAMQCEAVREKLAGFVDGELTVAEYAAVERHVAECVECAAALERQRVAIDSLIPLRAERAPAGLLDSIAEASGAQCKPRPRAPIWRAAAGFLLGAGLFTGAALALRDDATKLAREDGLAVDAVNTAVRTLRSSGDRFAEMPEVALLAALSTEMEGR